MLLRGIVAGLAATVSRALQSARTDVRTNIFQVYDTVQMALWALLGRVLIKRRVANVVGRVQRTLTS
jgi:hypothetical protein